MPDEVTTEYQELGAGDAGGSEDVAAMSTDDAQAIADALADGFGGIQETLGEMSVSQGRTNDLLGALPVDVSREVVSAMSEGEGEPVDVETVTYTVQLDQTQYDALSGRLAASLYASLMGDFMLGAMLGAMVWRSFVGAR